ncbi:HupE/UreJ family protein [Alloyangia pacifica]|uniref:HupE / UreJ protein n=1 Tax=Alloyangia pacifica TaxID=311180 RepID=A0A1I6QQ03_9RHOB|nr:HupE/UreJ family protein [Alloyangia pacifica]SDF94981.1 HupE / UreJ protein [Alloyangia pacifica]SFS54536.1 HupE / UreJ protein [Alloyangia pacifica]
MRNLLALILLLTAALHPGGASAHALDPGFLELSAMDGTQWRVSWRMPDVNGRPMPISPRLPENCQQTPAPDPAFDGRAWVTSFLATCPEGLAGGSIGIDGLERTRTDVLVRYELEPGQAQTQRLTAGSPEFSVPAELGPGAVFASYVALGVSHILEGVDHLLFVFALLLLVRQPRRLLWAITAFTLAHSLTLAAATLGLLRLPSAPVEVVVALSIVFLAYELALPPERRDPVSERFPALVSFGFGLVHGLGFAGALREIGLPQSDIPLALLSFNVGVELGQLMFIALVLSLGFLARRMAPVLADHGARLSRLASYGIGSIAAFWVIERMAAF